MNENRDFAGGIFTGMAICFLLVVLLGIFKYKSENEGYENKLIVKYHNPNREYDREMVRKMIDESQIWTNFVEKSIKMDKYRIEYRMTNPRK